MLCCVADNSSHSDVSKKRSTYQPSNMKCVRSVETSGHVTLPAAQRNIPEDKNRQVSACSLKPAIKRLLGQLNPFKYLSIPFL
jgi:hypothetical protein